MSKLRTVSVREEREKEYWLPLYLHELKMPWPRSRLGSARSLIGKSAIVNL